MGFFDDLAMGLGFKERTQDYDARTARTIAARDASNRTPTIVLVDQRRKERKPHKERAAISAMTRQAATRGSFLTASALRVDTNPAHTGPRL